MENGRDKCGDSPTLKAEQIKEALEDVVCVGNIYDEEIVRDRVDRILVFSEYMDICCKNGDKTRIEF